MTIPVHSDPTARPPNAGQRDNKRLMLALSVLIVITGLFLAWGQYVQAGRHMDDAFLRTARQMAQGLNLNHIALLTGSTSDLECASYVRTKNLLMAIQQIQSDCRFVYLMARNQTGGIVFLADGEPADSPNYSPPGDLFFEAEDAEQNVFDSAQETIVHNTTDRWGSWVSVYIPLIHPDSGDVFAVFGMDIDAHTWSKQQLRSTWPPLLLAVALLLLQGLAWRLHQQALHDKKQAESGWMYYREPLIILLAGVLISWLATQMVHQADSASRTIVFEQLANSEANRVYHRIRWLRSFALPILASFFEASDKVTPEEFARFVQPLLQTDGTLAWGWIPEISAAQVTNRPTAIWQFDLEGNRVPVPERQAYFPLTYIVPEDRHRWAIGFDLASNELRANAIHNARSNRLATATQPLHLITESPEQVSMIIFHPVEANQNPNGLVLATLSFDALLMEVRHTSPLHHILELYNPHTETRRVTASTCPMPHHPLAGMETSYIYNMFGHILHLRIHPEPQFYAHDRYRAVWTTAVTGILISLALSILSAVPLRQRRQLEDLIVKRTGALADSEKRFRTLFTDLPVSVILHDPADGRIVDANPAAWKSFGFSSFTEMQTTSFWMAPPYSFEEALAWIHRCDREGPQCFEWCNTRQDGSLFYEQVYLNPIRIDGQKRMLSLSIDITERRQAEHALKQLLQEAEMSRKILLNVIEDHKHAEAKRLKLEAQLVQSQKLEAIGTLASGVAHEINNPIMGIMNYAQLIADESDPTGTIAEFAVEINRETERVAAIVRNLLSFARQDQQAHSPARIHDIVTSVMSLVKTVLRHDNIKIDVDVSENLPEINCRSQQIQQVVMNLITNARDALNTKYGSSQGVKKIRIYTTHFDEDHRSWIRLTVEDNGPGISNDVKQRMFDPFFTTKQRNQGTGLGLSISHGIATDHHGRLVVETIIGEGTRMHLVLPVAHGWSPGPAPGG